MAVGLPLWDFSGEKITRSFKSLLNERGGEVAGKPSSTPYRLVWGAPRLERLTENQNQVFEWAVCIVNDVLRRAAKIHMGPFAVIFPPLAGVFDPGWNPSVSVSAPPADTDIAALKAAKVNSDPHTIDLGILEEAVGALNTYELIRSQSKMHCAHVIEL